MQTAKQPDILDINEIATQQQLQVVSSALQRLSMIIGQAFPMLGQPIHDLAQEVDRRLVGIGRSLTPMILTGHGPRTVARLRLAADDKERAEIMDTLPRRYVEDGALPHRISLMVSSRLGDNTPALKSEDETRIFVGSNEIPELDKVTFAKSVREYFAELSQGTEQPRSGFFNGAPEGYSWNQSLVLRVEHNHLVLIPPNPKAKIQLYTYVVSEDAWVEHDDFNYIHQNGVESAFRGMLKECGTLSVAPMSAHHLIHDALAYMEEESVDTLLPVVPGEANEIASPDNHRGADKIYIVRPAFEETSPVRHAILRTERKGLQMVLRYGSEDEEPTLRVSYGAPGSVMPAAWESFTPIAQRQLRRIFIDAIYNSVQQQKSRNLSATQH